MTTLAHSVAGSALSRRTSRLARQAGFNLFELMITVAVLATLAAIAVPSMQRLIASQRLATGASDLFFAIVMARSEAIKRNSNVSLTPVGGDWGAGWQSTDTATGAVLDNHGSLGGTTVAGPAAVVYQSSGRLQAVVTPFNFTSTVANVAPRCITLDLTGRPSVKQATC